MKSKRRMIVWITTAVTVAVLATLLWAPGSVQAGPLAQVPLRITYQGRLTDPDGQPLTGNYDFTFRIYNAQSGGTPLWSEQQNNVSVDDGVFTVQLGQVTALDPADFDGSTRWLQVLVRQAGGATWTTLSPRQPLVSVPYALRARDADLLDGQHASAFASSSHSHDHGSLGGLNDDDHPQYFHLSQNETVTGRPAFNGGASASTPPFTVDSTYRVTNLNADLLDGQHGSAFASASHNHWGQTWTGSGTGLTLSGGTIGLEGSGSDYGIYGTSSGGYSVYGYSSSSGRGVYGYSSSGSGTGGRCGGTNYYALWGYHEDSNGYALGVNQGQAVFNGYVTFNAGKSGYVVEIALNDDNVPLEQGDVVVISGYGPSVVGQVPVIKVRKATEAYATGVVGVVDVLYEVGPKLDLDQLEDVAPSGGFRPEVTTIQPGQYLSIVTLGAYQGVKVNTGRGEVRPGDLLVSAGTAGQAMAAQSVLVEGVPIFPQGAIVGKLLGPPDPATGLAPIFVTLH